MNDNESNRCPVQGCGVRHRQRSIQRDNWLRQQLAPYLVEAAQGTLLVVEVPPTELRNAGATVRVQPRARAGKRKRQEGDAEQHVKVEQQ